MDAATLAASNRKEDLAAFSFTMIQPIFRGATVSALCLMAGLSLAQAHSTFTVVYEITEQDGRNQEAIKREKLAFLEGLDKAVRRKTLTAEIANANRRNVDALFSLRKPRRFSLLLGYDGKRFLYMGGSNHVTYDGKETRSFSPVFNRMIVTRGLTTADMLALPLGVASFPGIEVFKPAPKPGSSGTSYTGKVLFPEKVDPRTGHEFYQSAQATYTFEGDRAQVKEVNIPSLDGKMVERKVSTSGITNVSGLAFPRAITDLSYTELREPNGEQIPRMKRTYRLVSAKEAAPEASAFSVDSKLKSGVAVLYDEDGGTPAQFVYEEGGGTLASQAANSQFDQRLVKSNAPAIRAQRANVVAFIALAFAAGSGFYLVYRRRRSSRM